ncbi:protein kinase [Ornithinibacillus halotolerans]|uniref:Protein kinase n=1 Tax=Ornithinibacillus halotolerans TaxID=1274357 RepID=A0A916W656_9BACI|nr:protein kinase [Ornithinibacillus halotolerans]GGA70017.1 hypothetical protein GCM10008025_12460 [Ornithinibacillus halotolerans]
MKRLQDIINNWKSYCTPANFIGIGSTRKAYRIEEFVIKVHIHPLGYKQSLNELRIYNEIAKRKLHSFFAKVYYVDEQISVQHYYTPLELVNNQTYEIDSTKHQHFIPKNYQKVFNLLDDEFNSFDIRDSSNYGLDEENKLIFIDFGMTKKLYEEEWVPLAEAGILPQIDFDVCLICGEEKELRMYGENDTDKRCVACGKE